MKIYFTYKTTEKPWGGANNFLRSLKVILSDKFGVISTDNIAQADVIFMNQVSAGPESNAPAYSLRDIKNFRHVNKKAKIIFRAVNLKSHSNPQSIIKYYLGSGFKTDHNIIQVLNAADYVVYQSQYQKSFFELRGARPLSSSVILNGASNIFKDFLQRPLLHSGETFKILSTANANRNSKRQDIIAAISLMDNVKVYHAGLWPETVSCGNVNLCGVLDHSALREVMNVCHYFLHPAIHDPCPNSLIEGLFAGMPALYNPGVGSGAEIAANYGVAIDTQKMDKTISEARVCYETLCSKLSNDRHKFGIERAAEEYYKIFQSSIREQNG